MKDRHGTIWMLGVGTLIKIKFQDDRRHFSVQPINTTIIPSGYLTVCHGKSPSLIGKPSISIGAIDTMAMLNNRRLIYIIYNSQ